MIELILGLDPSPQGIPMHYKTNKGWDILRWGTDIMDVCSGHIAGVKFQSAYFEMHGLDGLKALSGLIKEANDLNLKTIMDAKRGDIGLTSTAYANAYLSGAGEGVSDFSCDYLTVNPLMGEDCLDPFADLAHAASKGIFVLLETSNPGAAMILKERLVGGGSVADKICDYINLKHQRFGLAPKSVGPIGVVVGATNTNASDWREKLPNSIFLMPGIGAQGGDWGVVNACQSHAGVWVPISRGITMVQGAVEGNYLDQVKSNVLALSELAKQQQQYR